MAKIASLVSILSLFTSLVHSQIVINQGNQVIETRLDPVVSPGVVASHVHAVVGGSNFGSIYDGNLLQQSSCTTSVIAADKSNYWTPLLYFAWNNGTFTVVPHGGANVYYLNRPDVDTIIPFPPGFKMYGGDPTRRTYDPTSVPDRAVSFVCLGGTRPQGPSMMSAADNCPGGWRMQINMPQCWDGVNLYLPGSAHVSYATAPDGGACPSSHPKHFISLFYEFFYMTGGEQAKLGMTPANGQFVLANGDTTGYSFHGDFQNGWDQGLLTSMVSQCFGSAYNKAHPNGGISDCPPLAAAPQSHKQCLGTGQRVNENIGDVFPITSLPGCNPVGNNGHPVCGSVAAPGIMDIASGNIVVPGGGNPLPSVGAPSSAPTSKASSSTMGMGMSMSMGAMSTVTVTVTAPAFTTTVRSC